MTLATIADYLYYHSFPRFCLVGTVGFVVDATLLVLLHHAVGLSVTFSRLVSFGIALTVTWLLNRRITFKHSASVRKLGEWMRYVTINGSGGVINLAVFFWMTHSLTGMAGEPLPALATASLIALLFNYAGSRVLVFNAHRSTG